jgi:hypothetical protein
MLLLMQKLLKIRGKNNQVQVVAIFCCHAWVYGVCCLIEEGLLSYSIMQV